MVLVIVKHFRWYLVALCDCNKDECSEGDNNEVMMEEVDDKLLITAVRWLR